MRWARGAEGATRLRITPQLIRVSDDIHLWAKSYDRLMDDVFQIQSEIAAKVVAELGVTLEGPERRVLERRPTEDLEAYRLALRGEYYLSGPAWLSFDSQLQAAEHLRRAVELDPAFTAAWQALVITHGRIYSFGYDASAERLEQVQQALDRAVELAPDDPETRLSKGFYRFLIERDYERALEEYSRAEPDLPNDIRVVESQAYALRRLGRFVEAATKLRRVLVLDPRNARVANDLAETYTNLRRYAEAESFADLAVAVDPDWAQAYATKAGVLLLRDGSPAAARAVLDAIPASSRANSFGQWLDHWLDFYDGKYGEALERLAASSEPWIGRPVYFRPKELLVAFAHSLRGESELARSAYDSARAILEAELARNPDQAKLLSALGVAYAGLGRKDEAIRHARRGAELMPLDKEGYFGLVFVEDLAWVYTLLGEPEAALAELELLLGRPSRQSWPLIELDPRWAPLRQYPRYRQLKSIVAVN